MNQGGVSFPFSERYERIGSDGYHATDDRSSATHLPRVVIGTEVIAFQSKIATGQEATGEYYLDAYEGKNYPGSYSAGPVTYVPGGVAYTDLFNGNLKPVDVFSHNTYDEAELTTAALSRFYSRIRSARTELHSLAVLGEGAQTLKMIKKPFSHLVDLTTDTFRILKNRKDSLRKLKALARRKEWDKIIAGTYLEWVFGVMPALMDIKDGMAALDRITKDNNLRNRIVGSSSSSSQVSESSESPIYGGGAYRFRMESNISTTSGVKYIGYMDLTELVAQNAFDRSRELLGFTPEDFLPSVYEVMPWSWLIDYFTNIGDLIEAGTTDMTGLKFIVKNIRHQSERVIVCTALDPNGVIPGVVVPQWSGDYGISVTRRTTLTRSRVAVADVPVPDLRFHHPGGSIKKLANMLAVAVSLRKESRDLSFLSRRGPR